MSNKAKQQNILLSIIIPVYNLENYIKECLDSLVKQITENVEIIIVNDGSTDNSEIICKEYCSKYPYIKYVYQENAGVSSARNNGLNLAIGKYIQFVDGDDWLLPNAIDEILKKIKNDDFDIICGRYVKSYDEKNQKISLIESKFIDFIEKSCYPQNLITLLKENLFNYGAGANITKRAIIINNNLLFDVKVKYTEDIMFFLNVLLNCKKIAIIQCHYVYRQSRNCSATSSISLKRVLDNLDLIVYWIKRFKKNDFHFEIQNELYNFLAYEYCIILGFAFQLEKNELNQIYKDIYKYRWLLKYNSFKKVKMVSTVYHIIGLKATGKLLGCFIKWKK